MGELPCGHARAMRPRSYPTPQAMKIQTRKHDVKTPNAFTVHELKNGVRFFTSPKHLPFSHCFVSPYLFSSATINAPRNEIARVLREARKA